MNEITEMKKDFFQDLDDWFKGGWYNNFKNLTTPEIINKLKFDKMRSFYELQLKMSVDEFTLFNLEVLRRIEILTTEMKLKGITYFTMRNHGYKNFSYIKIKVYYHEIETNVYEVYDNKNKMTMNYDQLQQYLKDKTREDFKKAIRKEEALI